MPASSLRNLLEGKGVRLSTSVLWRAGRELAMKLEKIGKARLKLRLPSYRHVLSELRSPALTEICIAYAEASMQLDRLRFCSCPDLLLIDEYERVCRELENSIEPYLRMFRPPLTSKVR